MLTQIGNWRLWLDHGRKPMEQKKSKFIFWGVFVICRKFLIDKAPTCQNFKFQLFLISSSQNKQATKYEGSIKTPFLLATCGL
jgi:hypothetical protein